MPKILVIDDSAFLRNYVRGFLEDAGYEVDDFLPLSALEVMDRARTFQPDLVMTDYHMPHVNGLDVIRMVRRFSRTVPVVVLTATRDPGREAQLREHQHLSIIHKPVKGEELVEAIRGILAS